MAEPTGEPLAVLVARARPRLLRTAVLLEDDPAAAGDLVRTTLVTVAARRRRAGDLLAPALPVLVRRALAHPAADGPRTSGWVDDASWAADPWDADEDLRRALEALPARTRAVVVLGVAAGELPGRIAEVLRLPEDAVRAELAAGAAALRAALPRGDADLRAALDGLADRAVDRVEDLPGDDVPRAVTARRRRRWLAAATAASLAAVLAVTAGNGQETGPALDPAPQQAAVDVGSLPPRGSLARDAAFLDGLLRQPWAAPTGEIPVDVTPAPGTTRVLFAGDVPGGRWALVTARARFADDRPDSLDRDDALMAWFTGPAGAAPEDMRLSTYPYPLQPGSTPALMDPRSGALVVVGAPGDVVEVSARAEVAADGSSSRTWTDAGTTDGVAVTRLPGMDLPWTWSVAYRVHRDGAEIISAPPDGVTSERAKDSAPALPPLGVRYPGGTPSAEGRQAAEWAAFTAAATLGISPADATITARLVAPAPAPAEGAVALVTVALPSGALLVSAQWAAALPDGQPGGADCGMDVRPAGPPAEERVLAAGCHLFAPAEGRSLDSVLVVTAPPSVALVRAYGHDGAFLGQFDAAGGTLVAPMPVGTREVEAVTAAGVLLGRAPLLGRWAPRTG
jgi:DNA-directed RNA polymerase specialized sigma24 family protein